MRMVMRYDGIGMVRGIDTVPLLPSPSVSSD